MKTQIKAAIAMAILAAAFAAGWTVNGWRADATIAEMKHDQLKSRTNELQAAADQTYAMQQTLNGALENAKKRNADLSARADHARAVSDRLQLDLAAIQRSLPELTEQAVRRYADAASTVLNECQREYAAVAKDADRLSSAAQTLEEAWPKSR